MSERRLRVAIAVLALAGAGIAAYLLWARYSGTRLACATGGCETVQQSSYAKLVGVPVAALGFGAYAALLASALGGRLWVALGAAVALGGLVFSIYLLVVQLAVVDAVCQWCLASDAIMAVLAVATVLRLRLATGAESPQPGSASAPMAPPG